MGQGILTGTARVWTDGRAVPNPGLGTWGADIQFSPENTDDATVVTQLLVQGRIKDPRVTNNYAEYEGLIQAMDWVNPVKLARYLPMTILEAVNLVAPTNVEVHTDSELMYCQCRGEYKTRKAELAKQQARLRFALAGLHGSNVKALWVPREENSSADELTNTAEALEPGEICIIIRTQEHAYKGNVLDNSEEGSIIWQELQEDLPQQAQELREPPEQPEVRTPARETPRNTTTGAA